MFNYLSAWCGLALDRRAITSVEYALIAGVLVATIVVGFKVFAGDLSDKFNTIATGI